MSIDTLVKSLDEYSKKSLKPMELGLLSATIGVSDRMAADEKFFRFVTNAIHQFRLYNWGVLSPEDRIANIDAIAGSGRVMGAYIFDQDHTKIWIITEADRKQTTVLFQEEY